MPLSDEEMRLLEQMERALVEEDPKFASTLRGTTLAGATRVRLVAAGVVFVVGLAGLMSGVVLGGGSGRTLGIVVGIVGFLLMLASATVGLSTWRGRQAPASGSRPAPQPDTMEGLSLIQGGKTAKRPRRQPGRTKQPPSSGSFMERLEERWQRRRGQNGL